MLASARELRAAANIRGRAMALPYKTMAVARPNGKGVTIRAAVGRDALIPPHPVAGQGPVERSKPFPANGAGVSGQPGKRKNAAPQTHVGADSISARRRSKKPIVSRRQSVCLAL